MCGFSHRHLQPTAPDGGTNRQQRLLRRKLLNDADAVSASMRISTICTPPCEVIAVPMNQPI